MPSGISFNFVIIVFVGHILYHQLAVITFGRYSLDINNYYQICIAPMRFVFIRNFDMDFREEGVVYMVPILKDGSLAWRYFFFWI